VGHRSSCSVVQGGTGWYMVQPGMVQGRTAWYSLPPTVAGTGWYRLKLLDSSVWVTVQVAQWYRVGQGGPAWYRVVQAAWYSLPPTVAGTGWYRLKLHNHRCSDLHNRQLTTNQPTHGGQPTAHPNIISSKAPLIFHLTPSPASPAPVVVVGVSACLL
jgi:hypothetical protein